MVFSNESNAIKKAQPVGCAFLMNQKTGSSEEGPEIGSLELSFLYVSSLKTALALLDVESYFLTFVKRFKSFALDS